MKKKIDEMGLWALFVTERLSFGGQVKAKFSRED